MNEGKMFEQDFMKSVPDKYFKYRFKDGTGNFNGAKNENVRFQATNICDFMIYADNLYLLELKSHKGKSIPLSCIRKNQLDGLLEAFLKGVNAGFILNFRDIEETYYISAMRIKNAIDGLDRKSISLEYVRSNGMKIPQKKKISRYSYDLSELIGN